MYLLNYGKVLQLKYNYIHRFFGASLMCDLPVKNMIYHYQTSSIVCDLV